MSTLEQRQKVARLEHQISQRTDKPLRHCDVIDQVEGGLFGGERMPRQNQSPVDISKTIIVGHLEDNPITGEEMFIPVEGQNKPD